MSLPNSPLVVPPFPRKPVYQFTWWQAFLIAIVIALIVEILVIKFMSIPTSTTVALTMLIYLFVTSWLDSPLKLWSGQVFITVVVVIIVVLFGYETYRLTAYYHDHDV